MKVLIVEDYAPTGLQVQRVLRKAGYDVLVNPDGHSALASLARGGYDALVTDWMMPGMDGIALIRRVREVHRPPPAILLVTALDTPEARPAALEAGADDYLTKPFEPAQLVRTLEACLRRRSQSLPPPSRPELPTALIPPYVAVVVAASTGGPPALLQLFRDLPAPREAAFFVVVHGPPWMLETSPPGSSGRRPCRCAWPGRASPSCPARCAWRPGSATCSARAWRARPGPRPPRPRSGTRRAPAAPPRTPRRDRPCRDRPRRCSSAAPRPRSGSAPPSPQDPPFAPAWRGSRRSRRPVTAAGHQPWRGP